MRHMERALEELAFPQVQYRLIGNYGETESTATTTATSQAPSEESKMSWAALGGNVVGALVGLSQQNKYNQAQLEIQEQIARDEVLTQAQLNAAQAQQGVIHAENMPLYLMIGGGILIAGAVMWKNRK